MSGLYPLTFVPVYKDYPWGNTRLPELFGRTAPAGIYAESWEVSTHRDGESIVANGLHAGRAFSELLLDAGSRILGSAVEGDEFPILIKLLDAATPLSVQVHPSNANAASVNGEAKTELWYFLNRAPAKIYCGLVPGTTPEAFIAGVEDCSVAKLLNEIPVQKGSAAFVPGGRVHSIATGCLLLEVQQCSNTTFRAYDWGRLGNDGKPRQLHMEQAMQVIDFADDADPVCQPSPIVDGVRTICATPYFVLEELTVSGEMSSIANGQSFHVLFSAEGEFEIAYGVEGLLVVPAGTSVLIPAELGAYVLSVREPLVILKVFVPNAE